MAEILMHMRSPLNLFQVAVMVLGLALTLAGQAQHQNPVQTAPVDEPRGAEKPAPPVAKGKQAIREVAAKCSTRIVVNADALFLPKHWTLRPEASETLDVLGPMIAKAGKHPVRIESYAGSDDPESYNRELTQRRAVTVRGWLSNHSFVPPSTPVAGQVVQSAPEASNGSAQTETRTPDQRVEIAIDTCE